MPRLIDLKTFTDVRGNLTVIEKVLPFDIKRVFYIYGVDDSIRGHHRHKKTIQAAVSIQGKCEIVNKSATGKAYERYILDSPSKCLIIYPEDYHWIEKFSRNCILMVFASEYFNKDDYIYERYND
jgi:dTDP-4-dehydrorhamnose 3,5-epimerase-like enzyme